MTFLSSDGLAYNYQTAIILGIVFILGMVELALLITFIILVVVRAKLKNKASQKDQLTNITEQPL
jgi:hypothetical protein